MCCNSQCVKCRPISAKPQTQKKADIADYVTPGDPYSRTQVYIVLVLSDQAGHKQYGIVFTGLTARQFTLKTTTDSFRNALRRFFVRRKSVTIAFDDGTNLVCDKAEPRKELQASIEM